MLALVQRVSEAGVTIDGIRRASIGQGLLVRIEQLAKKVLKLRIFSDPDGKMNLSVQDIQGEVLVVSQFTLAADTNSGNRPSFSGAASPEEGRRAYEHFLKALNDLGMPVQTGEFGADMKVNLVNDGPATFWLSR